MVIYNSNGTVYELRGPNPLLKEQSDWDKSAIKLSNLSQPAETIKSVEEPQSNIVNIRDELNLVDNPQTKVIRASEFIKELTAPIIEKEPEVVIRPPEPIKPPEPKEVQINAEPKLAKIIKERGVEFYCAPAVDTRKFVDSLYGSSYETIVYGDQFVFDAIVVAESDLQIQFWSVKPINKGSVVLKKVGERGERWWRVSKSEPKTGGYISLCDISDSNPDFS